jgi:hypothetical protein
MAEPVVAEPVVVELAEPEPVVVEPAMVGPFKFAVSLAVGPVPGVDGV